MFSIIGKKGEIKAANYLKKLGYKIIETNYKNNIGEIDIIAALKGVLCFVEVKTRSSLKFGLPRDAVTTHKQNKIKLVATSYLQQKNMLNSLVSFDVIDIIDDQITLIKNAF
jgi:putative endonuclease